jgi:hypothetical protein
MFVTADDLVFDPPDFQIDDSAPDLLVRLQRLGGTETLLNVPVLLTMYDADLRATPILTRTLAFTIEANSVATTTISWPFPAAGDYRITVQVDPDHLFNESNRNNNQAFIDITVHPPLPDETAPIITEFAVDGGEIVSTEQIELRFSAEDPTGTGIANGVESFNVIEFMYDDNVQNWIVVQESGWLPFDDYSQNDTVDDFLYAPYPEMGVHYMLLFVADGAGNISSPAFVLFNRIFEIGVIDEGEVQVFRLSALAGENYRVTVTPLAVGQNPDLYVWAPDNSLVEFSEAGAGQPDIIEFTAGQTGEYQIEVEGFTAVRYSLEIHRVSSLREASRKTERLPVRGRGVPWLGSDNSPGEDDVSVPSAPANPTFSIFLPIIVR